MKYCIYCRLDNNEPVFIGDDYRNYLCAEHGNEPEFVHDARDLKHFDDGIDLEEEGREISREQIEEHAQEFGSAVRKSRRPFGDTRNRKHAVRYRR